MASALDKLEAQAVFDPLRWMRRWTPGAVPAKFAPHHRALVEIPEPGHSQVRVVWRGSAKTTVTRGLVAWMAARGKARGVLWIRANGSDCKADREALQRIAESAGLPYTMDGQLQQIVVNNVPIWTRTPGGAVRGINRVDPISGEVVRPDVTIIDDLETRETARSKMQTDLIETWLLSDALQTGEQMHPMRTMMLGTPVTPTSLVAKAMRREAPFDAWDEPLVAPILNEQGDPNWPEVFDPTLKDRVPPITWATEYQLQSLPTGTLYFPPAQTVWADAPAKCPVWVGVDPAGDGKDATGIAAVALTDSSLWLVDSMRWEGDAAQMPLQVHAFTRRLQAAGHPVAGVLFEANKGAWSWAAREVRNMLAPITVQAEPPTTSKGERAIPVTLWHKLGRFKMAPHLQGTNTDTEWHTFTMSESTVSGHDDELDSGVWACGLATKGHTISPPIEATPTTDTG